MAQAKALHPAVHDEKAHEQNGGTCWANASAQAIISTQMRICGRKVDKHDLLTEELIKRYGKKGKIHIN